MWLEPSQERSSIETEQEEDEAQAEYEHSRRGEEREHEQEQEEEQEQHVEWKVFCIFEKILMTLLAVAKDNWQQEHLIKYVQRTQIE